MKPVLLRMVIQEEKDIYLAKLVAKMPEGKKDSGYGHLCSIL